jgi:hypothetical protein
MTLVAARQTEAAVKMVALDAARETLRGLQIWGRSDRTARWLTATGDLATAHIPKIS